MKKFSAVILSVIMMLSAVSVLCFAGVAVDATNTDATIVDATPVEAYKLGDVNDDGNISIVDAKLILKQIAGTTVFSAKQEAAADANSDGNISIADAKKILKVIAGTDTLIHVGEGDIDDEGWVNI